MFKRRDRTIIRALLNVYDKSFLERLIRDTYEQINDIKDSFIISIFFYRMTPWFSHLYCVKQS